MAPTTRFWDLLYIQCCNTLSLIKVQCVQSSSIVGFFFISVLIKSGGYDAETVIFSFVALSEGKMEKGCIQ